MIDKCVHTEHCCYIHGCKYGDPDCPVEFGFKPQSFECEECQEDKKNPLMMRINAVMMHNKILTEKFFEQQERIKKAIAVLEGKDES